MRGSKSIKIVSVLCAFVLLLCSLGIIVPIEATDEIYDNIIRLHILAESDSEKDQTLKLQLRDAILEEFGSVFQNCKVYNEAEEKIIELLPEIEEFSTAFIREKGFDYSVNAKYVNEYYPSRIYDTVRLPAGNYNSLKISIGNGNGHNWWCVIFPSLCIDSAKASEKLATAGLNTEQINTLTGNGGVKYRIKFKIAEKANELIYKIRKNLNK